MIRKASLLFALPLLLAACGEGEGASGQAAEETRTATPAIDARVAAARLVVDANGLSASDKGERIALRFGTPRADVDRLAESALKAKGTRSSNPECGAGPMDFTEVGPLQIAYQDGKFAGWFLNDGSGVVTSDGIAPGILLSALKNERPVRVIDESTLDGEFEYQTGDAGMITGFYEGSGGDGTIVGLQAGLNCFFR